MKLTEETITDLGFNTVKSCIQDSYLLILKDEKYKEDFLPEVTYSYKAISLSLCNDKGQGEFYLFLREGFTDDRTKDEIVTITRNLQYVEDLEEFIRLTKL